MNIRIETLDKIFNRNNNAKTFRYDGTCHICGRKAEVSITKTSSGYGFAGGVMLEQKENDFKFECDECYSFLNVRSVKYGPDHRENNINQ